MTRQYERETGLRPNERRAEILKLVQMHGEASIDQLTQLFGVSLMTIHRDLESLAGAGKILKVRGGARAMESEFTERDVFIRRATNVQVKDALAIRAAELVPPHSIVALDDSTTVAAVFTHLVNNELGGVITHSLELMNRIGSEYSTIPLTGIGGRYVAATDSFLGASTNRAMETLSATYSIVSTTSVARGALYHPDEDAASTKRALCELGSRSILVFDSSKFHNTGMHFVRSLSDFDDIVVDAHLGAEDMDMLYESGARIHQVETSPPETTISAPLQLK